MYILLVVRRALGDTRARWAANIWGFGGAPRFSRYAALWRGLWRQLRLVLGSPSLPGKLALLGPFWAALQGFAAPRSAQSPRASGCIVSISPRARTRPPCSILHLVTGTRARGVMSSPGLMALNGGVGCPHVSRRSSSAFNGWRSALPVLVPRLSWSLVSRRLHASHSFTFVTRNLLGLSGVITCGGGRGSSVCRGAQGGAGLGRCPFPLSISAK